MSDAPVPRMAADWGEVARLVPVAHRENAIYELTLSDGRRLALRFHRPGYRDDAEIDAELDWTDGLARSGFPCPRPAARAAGGWLARSGGLRASAVEWIDAAPLSNGVPGPAAMRDLGALVARLHAAPPASPLARPAWDAEALLGPDPLWGPFWRNPSLSGSEAQRLLHARAAAQRALEHRDVPVGAIHADLLAENVLVDAAGGLHLIDFDDCGPGYLPYDLGTALIQHWFRPDYPELKAALMEGYGTRDDPDLFVALRAMASAGWAIGRFSGDDPRQRGYVDRALAVVERVFHV